MKTHTPHALTFGLRRLIAAAIWSILTAPGLLAFDVTPYPDPHAPDGSAAYPWKVNQPEDFDAIGTDGIHLGSQFYSLIQDLDFAEQDHRVSVNFSGNFNGGYHSIANIHINQPAATSMGLFTQIMDGGVIRCLGVVDSYFRAGRNVAPIVGVMQPGSLVEQCYSRGNEVIAATDYAAGGLVAVGAGASPFPIVRNSFVRDSSVSCATQIAGGISGYHDARVENCYSAGNTFTSPYNLGGVVAYCVGYGAVSVASYSDATNIPSVQVGGFYGVWQNTLISSPSISGFDIKPYSIAALGWDPAIWAKGSDGYPCLIGFNTAPVADAGDNQTVECAGSLTLVDLDGSASSDPDGDTLEFEWSVASSSGATIDDPQSATTNGWFPLGATMATLTVTDGRGGLATADVVITVVDSTPPTVVCSTDVAVLWPPNHKLREVEISVTVTDASVVLQDLSLTAMVSSSEPDNGQGDGAAAGDVDGLDGFTASVPVILAFDPDSGCFRGTVQLRAERDGSQPGRCYSIVSEVTDLAGNLTTASCVVLVPNDKKK